MFASTRLVARGQTSRYTLGTRFDSVRDRWCLPSRYQREQKESQRRCPLCVIHRGFDCE